MKLTDKQMFFLKEIKDLKARLSKEIRDRDLYGVWYLSEKKKCKKDQMKLLLLNKRFEGKIKPINKKIADLQKDIKLMSVKLDRCRSD